MNPPKGLKGAALNAWKKARAKRRRQTAARKAARARASGAKKKAATRKASPGQKAATKKVAKRKGSSVAKKRITRRRTTRRRTTASGGGGGRGIKAYLNTGTVKVAAATTGGIIASNVAVSYMPDQVKGSDIFRPVAKAFVGVVGGMVLTKFLGRPMGTGFAVGGLVSAGVDAAGTLSNGRVPGLGAYHKYDAIEGYIPDEMTGEVPALAGGYGEGGGDIGNLITEDEAFAMAAG